MANRYEISIELIPKPVGPAIGLQFDDLRILTAALERPGAGRCCQLTWVLWIDPT